MAAAVGAPPPVAATSIAQRDSEVVPLAEVSVWELVVQVLIVERPAIASSIIEVMLSFTVSPHVPESSPVTGSANFNVAVYCVVI